MSDDEVMYAIACSQNQQQAQLRNVINHVDYIARRCDEIAALSAQMEQIKKAFAGLLEKNNIEVDSQEWMEVLGL